MQIMTVKDVDLKGKRVLVREDLNVPRDKKTRELTDDTRIRAAVPTIKYLIEQEAKVIIMSHLGRPKGEIKEELRLDKVGARLSEYLNQPVTVATDCIGESAKAAVAAMKPGDVVLLENVRFYPEEEKNDDNFSKELAKFGDIFVNDAFGTAHRAHCSTCGVGHFLPTVAGFLMDNEIKALSHVLNQSESPFVAIIGGAKVSAKIGVIENLLNKVDSIIIGGGMANTFLAAKGCQMGTSLMESDKLAIAQDLMNQAQAKGKKMLLPVDLVIAQDMEHPETAENVDIYAVPADKMALDIGEKTRELYINELKTAHSIFWNGPMGVFEVPEFAKGTFEIAHAIAATDANSVIGGGDSVAAVQKAGLWDQITHISTGGGASLEYLEGKTLPGIAVIQTKAE